MARGKGYLVGEAPPQVVWTIVRGDTSSFKVYVADDAKVPLRLEDWSINMEIKRPQQAGVISASATPVLSLSPAHDEDDSEGEFTVFLTAEESEVLQTGDVFDIELSLPADAIVWTVAQGTVSIIEDVTD